MNVLSAMNYIKENYIPLEKHSNGCIDRILSNMPFGYG